MELKTNTWLTLEETKEWLRIKADNKDHDNILIRLINTACSRVETFIDGPVLTREFVEQRDGTSSNVIVPSHRPITEIIELKIDYNRNFTDSTAIEEQNFMLRGIPSLKQLTSDAIVQIRGTDVCLVDDGNTTILGQLFYGSVLQSIQIKYRAGWGDTKESLPDDLVHGTLMLVEYLYILKENRELNVTNKSTFQGQSYARDTGIPEEITSLLEPYKDYSFGNSAVPQRNTFSI